MGAPIKPVASESATQAAADPSTFSRNQSLLLLSPFSREVSLNDFRPSISMLFLSRSKAALPRDVHLAVDRVRLRISRVAAEPGHQDPGEFGEEGMEKWDDLACSDCSGGTL